MQGVKEIRPILFYNYLTTFAVFYNYLTTFRHKCTNYFRTFEIKNEGAESLIEHLQWPFLALQTCVVRVEGLEPSRPKSPDPKSATQKQDIELEDNQLIGSQKRPFYNYFTTFPLLTTKGAFQNPRLFRTGKPRSGQDCIANIIKVYKNMPASHDEGITLINENFTIKEHSNITIFSIQ